MTSKTDERCQVSAGTPDGKEKLREMILDERKKGNVVFWGLPEQLAVAPLSEIIKQPADGLLYDLNRLEEVCMTFLDDPKWVNDFAGAQVIRKLHGDRARLIEALRKAIAQADGWSDECRGVPAESLSAERALLADLDASGEG